jgi:membrane-associated protease RseP (regulator of RpoE activity)
MSVSLNRLSALAALVAVLLAGGGVWCWAQAPTGQYPASQAPAGSGAVAPSTAPQVIHIHHHYHVGSYSTELASAFAPQFAWNYGFQPGTGNIVRPWTQDWGHLGFTGYIGQRAQYTGLVVDTLTPGSPAAKMGLVQGDFILAINGQKVDNYKQVTILFDQTVDKPEAPLSLQIWNPTTGRTITLRAELDSGGQ